MSIEIADVVVSLGGRDDGKRFVIIGTDGQYSFLCDGKGRRIEKPKRKKNKHLKPEDKIGRRVAEKLVSGEKVANSEIRRALAEYSAARGEEAKDPRVKTPDGVKGGMQSWQRTI
jgi:ribosomal protein L14E/L6E/L27E